MIYHAFEIRKALESDVDAIDLITKEGFNSYMKYADIKKLDALNETKADILNDIKEKNVFIAFINNIPVGSLRIAIKEDVAYLSRFSVRDEYQNNGIGKALMNTVDILMSEMNIKSLILHTASKATPLMKFYYSRGFHVKDVDTERGYIRVLMEKTYN